MLSTIQSYIRTGRHTLRRLALDPRVHTLARSGGWFFAGFLLSAASLGTQPQPIALGLLCAGAGWPALLIGTGGALGYLVFWGSAGLQGVFWLLLGLPCAALLGERRIARDTPMLLPALAALIVSGSGVIFQQWLGDDTSIPMYLLRVVLGTATTRLFTLVRGRREPVLDWIAAALAVLALAQVAPLPYLGLGFLAAGVLGAMGSFPLAVLSGLALDLARVTPAPMTGVLCFAFVARLIPWQKRWPAMLAPGMAYILICSLKGVWDLHPLPGLLIGGAASILVPSHQARPERRRGETGVAQVRLELASAAMAQTQQLLMEAAPAPIDEAAIIARGAERACGSCPCRKGCRDRDSAMQLSPQLLHRPLLDSHDLPVSCKKSGRLLSELHRCQEQLRAIRADRERQKEYRAAVVQQYRFLSGYLQDLADQLPRRSRQPQARFQIQVAASGNRPQEDNGDRCLWFAGTECRYYILLCDGMGTGMGAVDEGKSAGTLLKLLLTAGFPAQYALRSLNSLCALRGRAGAATVDLAEVQLDTGRVTLYKWGAAPSWLMTRAGAEKIGTAGPPPGLSVTDGRETVERLSLRRGETLVLLSDGMGGEDALRWCSYAPEEPPGELAARLLKLGAEERADDATVVAIRLSDLFSAP